MTEDKDKDFVAFISGKGGVGKTVVTVGTARCYSRQGSVGILDVDQTSPNLVPEMPELEEKMEIGGTKIHPARAGNIEVVSHGMDLPEGLAMTRGAGFRLGLLRDYLEGAEWKSNVIFLDTPPGVVDEHLAILRSLKNISGVVVSTGARTALMDAERSIDMIATAGVQPLGVVLNMLTYKTEKEELPLFNQSVPDNLRGVPVIARIPFIPGGVPPEYFQPIVDKINLWRKEKEVLM